MELATLVFIQYKTLDNGEKEEIPIKVVDTGYGLERIAWISQGTPTAYDACFAPVVDKLKELTDVKVNTDILARNAQIAGMMDIEDIGDIKELRQQVANSLGITLDELLELQNLWKQFILLQTIPVVLLSCWLTELFLQM